MEDIHDNGFPRNGIIKFTAGYYSIFVPADLRDLEDIEYSIEENDYSTCSHLDTNIYNIEKMHRGFNLTASIESNEVKFIWFIR